MLRNQTSYLTLPDALLPSIASLLIPELAVGMIRLNHATRLIVHTNNFWQKKYKQHFPHLHDSVKTNNWYSQFCQTYAQEYEHIPRQFRKIFSVVKEGDSESLVKSKFTYGNMDLVDSNNKSLLTLARQVDNRRTLDHFYKISQDYFTSWWGWQLDVKKVDQSSRNMLYWATVTNQDLIEYNSLFTQGSSLSSRFFSTEYQAIHLAAMLGHYELVLFLVEKQPDLLNQEDALKETPLIWAVANNHMPIVKYLLSKAGINLNAFTKTDIRNVHGRTALHWAAHRDYVDMIQILIDAGMDVQNTAEGSGYQAIHTATIIGNVNSVKYLVENFPVLNAEDSFLQTPLLWAASLGFLTIVDYLLAKPNINLNAATLCPNTKENGYTAVHWAIERGHHDILTALVLAGAALNLGAGNMQYASIHTAVIKGDLDAVNILIKHNRQLLNLTDNHGQTSLIWSASEGHLDIVDYLLMQSETDLNAVAHGFAQPGSNGMSALHWAIKKKQPEIAALLIQAGADLSLRADAGYEPITLAAIENQLATLQLLIQTDPTLLNHRDNLGQTALLWAASKGHLTIVNYLLAQPGIDLNATTQQPGHIHHGKNALDWAIEGGHDAVVVSLLKKGMLPRDNLTNRKLLTPETQAKLALAEYISLRVAQSTYKRFYTLFGCTIGFGYSKSEKIAAATTLKEVVLNDGNRSVLTNCKKVLDNGQLGSMYRALRM